MKVTWTVTPLGKGKFRLADHHGREVATVTRKREVFSAGYEYLRRCDRRGDVDDIVFEGIGQIPSCIGRWAQRIADLIP